jgi:hypothetical protein
MLLRKVSFVLFFFFDICRTVVLRKMRTSRKYGGMNKNITTWSFCFLRRRDEPQETNFFQPVCECVCVCEWERECEWERQSVRVRAYMRFHINRMLHIKLHIHLLRKIYITATSNNTLFSNIYSIFRIMIFVLVFQSCFDLYTAFHIRILENFIS